METSLKAVIFDQDMTLINSYVTLQQIAQQVAKEHFPDVDHEKIPDKVTQLWGTPGDQFYTEMFGVKEDELPEIYEKIREIAKEYKLETFLGTVEALDQLSEKYTLGVLTSAGRALSKKALYRRGFDLNKISFFYTADDTRYHKPDPRAFDELIDHLENDLGIKREEAIYVGDALSDGVSSVGAGLHFVGVETGFVTKEEFKREGYKSVELIKDLDDYLEENFK